MEGIRGAAAMRRGIGQRIDDFQLFDDRARPSVRNDQRQRIFMFRTDVNEMDVEPVDLGDELWQGVQSCFDLAPVVICRPIPRERLSGRELYSLGCIGNRLSFGPLGRVDAPAQIGQVRLRNLYLKPTDSIFGSCLLVAFWCGTGVGHSVLLFLVVWISPLMLRWIRVVI